MKGGEFGYTFSEPEEERGGGTEDEQLDEREVKVNHQAAAPLSRKGKFAKTRVKGYVT
jgi:hypothetical protein